MNQVDNQVENQPPVSINHQHNNNQQTHNNHTDKKKLTIKWLGIIEMGISFMLICAGIAQICIEDVPCYRYENVCKRYDDCKYVLKHRRCYNPTAGENIWCSVFSLIAGIMGVLASSKTEKKKQINLLMGFSITGVIFMFVNISVIFFAGRWSDTRPARVLKKTSAFLAGINFILLIISSSFSCCFMNCCCKTESPQVVYVAYTVNNAGQPTTVVPINTQGSQLVTLNPPSNFQHHSLAHQPQSSSNDEPQHKLPPQYQQFENKE